MMTVLAYIILVIYLLALVYIAAFCLMQFQLLYHYSKQQLIYKHDAFEDADAPFISIQLPVYNELYVVARLIDAVSQFDYPNSKFEIRILDDSTDETSEIIAEKVSFYQKQGFAIEHIQRTNRQGYKAGALKDDLPQCKGDYIAIFDADFLPEKDFLQRTIPYFVNPEIGVVQTRWGHVNENYSLITRLQAFQLNVHFTVEQVGRENGHFFLQFNGTGGVWRKKTIEDAGGWEADTLTEDLDLSMRAQLKGYKIHYLEDAISPAELPAEMNGLKSQQFRWMKGGAETAKKLIPHIWKSDLGFFKKIHTTVHLLSSSVFLSIFLVGLFSVPVLFMVDLTHIDTKYFAIFLLSTLSIIAVYFVGNVRTAWASQNTLKSIFKFIFLFPIFLALSMGLSLHNSIAVLQGYRGKKSPFVRTPKFNIQGLTDKIGQKKYLSKKIPWTTIIEGLLCIYFIVAIILSIRSGMSSFVLFHFMLALGYGTICFFSIKHTSLNR